MSDIIVWRLDARMEAETDRLAESLNAAAEFTEPPEPVQSDGDGGLRLRMLHRDRTACERLVVDTLASALTELDVNGDTLHLHVRLYSERLSDGNV